MCRKNCSSSGNKNYCNWYCVELCSLNFSLRVLTVTTVTLITINLVLMGTVIFIVKLFSRAASKIYSEIRMHRKLWKLE